MGMTMRVSLPGYDCLTDGTIDHYSIYADSDNVLIKEFSRGTINIGPTFPNNQGTITHSLGYIPLAFSFANSGGTQVFVSGNDLSSSFPFHMNVGTSNIVLTNNKGGTITFSYFIFYDQL